MKNKKYLLCVLLFAVIMRLLVSNPFGDMENDQSQYAGAARDYMELGWLQESMTYKNDTFFMPPAYPYSIYVVMKVTGLNEHMAGVVSSILFGLASIVLLYYIVLMVSGRAMYALVAALMLASNPLHIFYSGMVYTESFFIFCSLFIVFLMVKFFTSNKNLLLSQLIYPVLMGLVIGLAFWIRAGSLYLIGAVPVTLLLCHLLFLRRSFFKIILPVFFVVGVGAFGIYLNVKRLHELNGTWTLSPQLGFNVAVGSVVTSFDLNPVRLDEQNRNLIIMKATANDSAILKKWTVDPATSLSELVTSLKLNTYFFVSSFIGKPILALLFLVALFFGYVLWKNRKRPTLHIIRNSQPYEIAFVCSVLLVILHIGAYSLMMPWARYIHQIVPVGIIAIILLYGMLGVDRDFFNKLVVTSRDLLKAGIAYVNAHRTVFLLLLIPLLSAFLNAATYNIYVLQNVKGLIRPQTLAQEMGEKIVELSAGTQPQITGLSLNLVYYARGNGIYLPYGEANFEKISKFLQNHQIKFISTDKLLSVGGRGVFVLAVPIYQLFAILNQYNPQLIGKYFDGNLFFINGHIPDIAVVTDLDGEKPVSGSKDIYLLKVMSQNQVNLNPTFDCVFDFEKFLDMKGVLSSQCFNSDYIHERVEVSKIYLFTELTEQTKKAVKNISEKHELYKVKF